eukprot:CAMPEP_0179187378 /NCGR_PEP_ID=MMETSP0796-20121207/92980_1 /TAXON_ID=73915 /ORGANISM="Pyrodinium bahamense, Strain pbaha01" /LENGTH=34 /DNA_ID= /DNA_START= /DNA_END= /DNA_ORIENTATION=
MPRAAGLLLAASLALYAASCFVAPPALRGPAVGS